MVAFRLNGREVDVDVPSDEPLLYVLADDLQMNGVKFGCGKSQCGACFVLVDGEPVASCQTTVGAVAGSRVTTLEGLRNPDGSASLLQQAFIEEQAAQCGYCLSGMIVSARALLDANPNPTEAQIRAGLNDNLCRCGSHNRIVKAVLRAAAMGA